MRHLRCSPCGLRFAPAKPVDLTACPLCSIPLESVSSAAQLVGLRLFDPLDVSPGVPEPSASAARVDEADRPGS
jgi:hypothetical protein